MGVRPAGTHEHFDQSTGEVLFAVGCRDDRPIVDSGCCVHVPSGFCDGQFRTEKKSVTL